MKPDYRNWVLESLIAGMGPTTALCLAALIAFWGLRPLGK